MRCEVIHDLAHSTMPATLIIPSFPLTISSSPSTSIWMARIVRSLAYVSMSCLTDMTGTVYSFIYWSTIARVLRLMLYRLVLLEVHVCAPHQGKPLSGITSPLFSSTPLQKRTNGSLVVEMAAFTHVALDSFCCRILRSSCLNKGGIGSTKTEYESFWVVKYFQMGSLLLLPVFAPIMRKVSPADCKNVPAWIIYKICNIT
mgnify:CR=1 FL=1